MYKMDIKQKDTKRNEENKGTKAIFRKLIEREFFKRNLWIKLAIRGKNKGKKIKAKRETGN